MDAANIFYSKHPDSTTIHVEDTGPKKSRRLITFKAQDGKVVEPDKDILKGDSNHGSNTPNEYHTLDLPFRKIVFAEDALLINNTPTKYSSIQNVSRNRFSPLDLVVIILLWPIAVPMMFLTTSLTGIRYITIQTTDGTKRFKLKGNDLEEVHEKLLYAISPKS